MQGSERYSLWSLKRTEVHLLCLSLDGLANLGYYLTDALCAFSVLLGAVRTSEARTVLCSQGADDGHVR